MILLITNITSSINININIINIIMNIIHNISIIVNTIHIIGIVNIASAYCLVPYSHNQQK